MSSIPSSSYLADPTLHNNSSTSSSSPSSPSHNSPEEASPLDIANIICTEERINKAFSSLTKNKAPGPDGISNNLIILSWTQIKPYITSIFKDSLRFGFIPYPWQTSSGIFLFKPSKKQQYLPQNWRTINLCSCLLKMLEKIVLFYLNDHLHIDSSLNSNQLGFRKGRSTEEALHRVVSLIEHTLVKGNFALACFVDIKAAFDSISFHSIIAALEKRGVSKCIISWIVNLLCNRKVIYSLKGISLLKYMIKGTPQGGVLSPLLWNLVIDSLLSLLITSNPKPDFTQGFADDLVTAFTGEHLPTLIGHMQRTVDIISNWCKDNGLELSPHKTSLVLFTRKRKFSIDTPITIDGHTLSYSKDVRYLGVILDQKLNWTKHVDTVTSKATASLYTAQRAVGKSWGISAITTKWLYKSVIIPAVSYGSLIWAIQPNKTILNRLSKLQNLSTRTIIQCPRYTSQRTMEIATGSLPLHLTLRNRAYSSLFRLHGHSRLRTIHNNRTTLKPHSSSFVNNLSPTIDNWDIAQPESFPSPRFEVVIADDTMMKELIASHAETINKFDYACFTDGSKLNNQTGAALVLFVRFSTDPLTSYKWRLDDRNSVFQAEMMAIQESCNLLMSLPIHNSTIALFTDSLSSVYALTAEKSSSKICQSTRHLLDHLASTCSSISLTWIRGHSGVLGNELADSLAKEGSSCTHVVPAPLPYSFFKSSLRYHSFAQRSFFCGQADTSNPLLPLLTSFTDLHYAKFFSKLNRRDSRILTAFLDNKAPLLSFLYKIGKSSSPRCTYCLEDIQDNLHILLRCPALSYERLTYLGPAPALPSGTTSSRNFVSPLSLLKFLNSIPLFTEYSQSN